MCAWSGRRAVRAKNRGQARKQARDASRSPALAPDVSEEGDMATPKERLRRLHSGYPDGEWQAVGERTNPGRAVRPVGPADKRKPISADALPPHAPHRPTPPRTSRHPWRRHSGPASLTSSVRPNGLLLSRRVSATSPVGCPLRITCDQYSAALWHIRIRIATNQNAPRRNCPCQRRALESAPRSAAVISDAILRFTIVLSGAMPVRRE